MKFFLPFAGLRFLVDIEDLTEEETKNLKEAEKEIIVPVLQDKAYKEPKQHKRLKERKPRHY